MNGSASGPIIIGGGPAGCAAALSLAQAGASPLIIERSRETGDAICGGFLSWQSLASLSRMGIAPTELGGHTVRRVRLFAGQRAVETALPQPGLGVSRRRLDSFLMTQAMRAGAAVERGVRIRSIIDDAAVTDDGASLRSDAIMLATGKTALRGQLRSPPEPAASDPVAGLRLRIAPDAGLQRLVGDAVELFLFDRGYAGLVLQEDGSANLCLAVHKSRLGQSGGNAAQLVRDWTCHCPALGDRVGAMTSQSAFDAIAAIPYGWMVKSGERGVWRLGDQAACIPSLAGEGMGIALASGQFAARAWQAGGGADIWQEQLARRLRRPMLVARAVWHVTERPRPAEYALSLAAHMPWLVGAIARMTRVPT